MNTQSTATAPIETGAPPPKPEELQPTRKRRGRPFAAKNAAPPLTETVVGVDPKEAPTDAAQPRKQRRSKTVDSDALAKQLKGIHSLAAKMLPITVNGKLLLELSDTEATELANAVAGVCKEYDLALDGKTGSAIQLIAVASMIYGPKIFVIQGIRTQMRRAAQPQGNAPDPSSVVAEQNLNGAAATN